MYANELQNLTHGSMIVE
jgi:hypothetical protein